MPIFKYTLKKYMKATSTWVIVGVSMFMVIVLGGYLPWHYFSPDKNNAVVKYGVISVALVAGITSFLAIFTSVFAGFKSATMYKDEVEDGTFLVMLSKPVTRSKIIFFKWLALQSATAMYTLIVAISFLVAIVAFDKGYQVVGLDKWGIHTLRSQAVLIAAALWGILFVVSLIFSSIALLLSTKLTVGTTIGISIAIGVIIPITSLVATFTAKQKYYSVSSNNAMSLEAMLSSQGAKSKSNSELVDPAHTLYGLGVETKENDAFKFAQVFDFNYQIQTLSEFASDKAIPDSMKGALASSASGERQMKITNTELSKDNTIPVTAAHQVQIDAFNALVTESWKRTDSYRKSIIEFLTPILLFGLKDGELKVSLDKESVTIDASNKDKIFGASAATGFEAAWKNAQDDYQTWEAKFNTAADDAAKLAVQRDYYLSNAFAFKVGEAIHKNTGLLDKTVIEQNIAMINKLLNPSAIPGKDKTANEVIEMAKAFGEELHFLESPLGFWIDENNFAKLRGDNYKNAETNLDPYTASLGVLGWTVKGIDDKLMGEVIAAINNDFHVVKINTVDYSSKWTILWIYLALALALVPVSYFVVRKQDFR